MLFEKISAGLIFSSSIPYLWGIFRGKTHHSFSAWLVWLWIGLAVLLTYRTSGARGSLWAVVFGFFDPLLIVIFLLLRNGKPIHFTPGEKACLVLASVILVQWVIFVFIFENAQMAQYSFYFAIGADMIAAILQYFHVRRNPSNEKPFAWGIYAIGYGVALFGLKEYTFENMFLPGYMAIMYGVITIPLVRYRLVYKKYRVSDWI